MLADYEQPSPQFLSLLMKYSPYHPLQAICIYVFFQRNILNYECKHRSHWNFFMPKNSFWSVAPFPSPIKDLVFRSPPPHAHIRQKKIKNCRTAYFIIDYIYPKYYQKLSPKNVSTSFIFFCPRPPPPIPHFNFV